VAAPPILFLHCLFFLLLSPCFSVSYSVSDGGGAVVDGGSGQLWC